MILAFAIPLFFVSGPDRSWMAYDEGLYVTRAKLMMFSGDWIHPFNQPHHKPPGFYWLQAVMFSLFGVSEYVSRLPSMVSGVISLLLVYRIGRMLGIEAAGFVGAFVLGTSYLFFKYSSLAAPDGTLLALGLGMVAATIASVQPTARFPALMAGLAGAALGLILLVRGPVGFALFAALVPYLWATRGHAARTRVLGMTAGFAIGAAPVVIWLMAVRFGHDVDIFGSLMGFSVTLATEIRADNGPFYYFANLVANCSPWSVVSLAGLVVAWRRFRGTPELWLILGFPIALFVMLSAFSTRTAHYGLNLYPWIALLCGLTLTQFAHTAALRLGSAATTLISGLGLLVASGLFFAGRIDLGGLGGTPLWQLGTVAAIAGAVGVAGAILAFSRPGLVPRGTAPAGVFAFVTMFWVAAIGGASVNLTSNINPEFHDLLTTPGVEEALTRRADFIALDGKSNTLARSYSQAWGRDFNRPARYSRSGIAWVPVNRVRALPGEVRVIAQNDKIALVEVRQ